MNSHPNKKLKDHLKEVADFSWQIVNSKNINTKKENLNSLSFIIGLTHDFGKATNYFQNYLKTKKSSNLSNHSLISSLFTFYVLKEYCRENDLDKKYCFLGWKIVLKHHGNLQTFEDYRRRKFRMDLEATLNNLIQQVDAIDTKEIIKVYNDFSKKAEINFTKLISSFLDFNEQEFKETFKELKKIYRSIDKKIENYFIISFLYSVLLDADKLSASGAGLSFDDLHGVDLSKKMVDMYKKKKFGTPRSKLNKERESFYKEAHDNLEDIDIFKNRFLSLNMPTGSGKTLTGTSIAFELRKKITEKLNFSPKIIYSLPFLTILDQNAEVVEEVIRESTKFLEIPTNLLLVDHHLAPIEYKTTQEEKESEIANLLIKGWHSEIVFTSFVQLFESLISNKSSNLRRFHNITNSIIIIDEIQALDVDNWNLVSDFLKDFCEFFNCWIVNMTATNPEIFSNAFPLVNLAKEEETFWIKNSFISSFENDKTIGNLETLKEEVLYQIKNTNKDLLVVLNTRRSCKDFYELLKDSLSKFNNIQWDNKSSSLHVDLKDGLFMYHLSNNLVPKDILTKIKSIKSIKDRKIIVSTQLIEAGVDISVDMTYRDLAPLESIIQTAGRTNRTMDLKKGEVVVCDLKKENGYRYSNIYDSVLIKSTLELFKNNLELLNKSVKRGNEIYFKNIKNKTNFSETNRFLEYVQKLFFGKLKEFKLIKNNYPQLSVLICNNEQVEKVLYDYKQAINTKFKNPYKRKVKLKRIQKKLEKYIVNLTGKKEISLAQDLPKFFNFENYRILKDSTSANCNYNSELGFYIEESNFL